MKSAAELAKTIVAMQNMDREVVKIPEVKSEAWEEIQNSKLSAVFGKRFVNATIENYQIYNEKQTPTINRVKAYLENIDEIMNGGFSMVFAGSSGTGKDHLLAAIGRKLIENNIELNVAKFYMLVAGALEAQSNGKNYIEYLKPYVNVHFLMISEVGMQKNSDFERKIMYHLIDERYKDLKPFIITTNLSVEALKTTIDSPGQARIWDRLTEIARVLPFNWSSYRGKNGK